MIEFDHREPSFNRFIANYVYDWTNNPNPNGKSSPLLKT